MKSSNKILAAAAALLIVIIAAFIILKPEPESPVAPVATVSASHTTDTVVVDQVVEEEKKPEISPVVKVQQVSKKLPPAAALNPAKYLVKNIKTRRNIVGKTVIEGTITNSSADITFKDMVIDVTYLSKTGATISTQRFTVYEIAKPGKKVPFKFKAKAPEGTKSFATDLVDAAVVK